MNFRNFGLRCVKHSSYFVIYTMAVVFVAGGCSYKKNNDVDVSAEEGSVQQQEGENYREMLERARNRKAYQHSLQQVKDAVKSFQVDLGRLPTNLLEMIRFRYLDEFPEQVPPGYTWGYDAVYGRVTFIEISEDQQGEAGVADQ